MKTSHFGLFSEQEEKFYLTIRKFRDKVTLPIASLLNRFGITPNQVSFFHFLFILPALYFLNTKLLYSLIFVVLHLIFDTFDGALARLQENLSRKGAFTDHAVDYAFFFILLLGLMFFRYTSPFIGALYLVNYLLVLGFSILFHHLRNENPLFVFKSREVIYLLFAVLCLSGPNLLDVGLMFFSVYMFLMNCYLFHRIRCSL